MFSDLIHDGVEVLLPGAVFVLPAVLSLLLQVCEEFEHLRNTQINKSVIGLMSYSLN